MKNKGISLITLVITIIIMIILAGAIILTLTNSGIFDKANEAVGKYNLKEVQAMAELVWAEAYDEDVTLDELKAAVNKVLEDNELDELYKAEVTEKGVTITENKPVEVPADWKSNVSTIVDGVPIPVGFAASPYDGTDGMPAENTKVGGLVIYELKEGETSATDIREADKAEYTDLKDIHYNSMETRNQFVWVPVDKENFATEFVRDDFGQMIWKYDYETDSRYEVALELSNKLGEEFWELVLDKDNMPSQDTENGNVEDYVSAATLQEATAMYESVAEYGGFYIARYEVGYTYDEEDNKVPSITMGKYPYNSVKWSDTLKGTANDGGAVALSRAFYPNNSTNTTGVVSTLTYGVQWDTTLNWWTGKDLTDSTEYGNYENTSIEEGEYNENAKYIAFDSAAWDIGGSWFVDSWEDAVAKGERDNWLLTTGAFKNANVNNVYDVAGNLWEWTMEGSSSGDRVCRGRGDAVVNRKDSSPYSGSISIGFRPSLYIKK